MRWVYATLKALSIFLFSILEYFEDEQKVIELVGQQRQLVSTVAMKSNWVVQIFRKCWRSNKILVILGNNNLQLTIFNAKNVIYFTILQENLVIATKSF